MFSGGSEEREAEVSFWCERVARSARLEEEEVEEWEADGPCAG